MEFLGWLQDFGWLVFGTLGVFVICGLTVDLIAKGFSALMGRGSKTVFDITAAVGTPVHELGHAMMCKLFGHKITAMKLWSPKAENGLYGYVEHSYSGKNLWARLGNLFIGMGPLFSGLGTTVLVLWLCFPDLWQNYLSNSADIVSEAGISAVTAKQLFSAMSELLVGLPKAIAGDPLRSILGLLLVLPVSLHISLSPADIRSSLSSFPIYLLLAAAVTLCIHWTPVRIPVFRFLTLFNLRLVSLFALVIFFSLFWLALGTVIFAVKKIISWF